MQSMRFIADQVMAHEFGHAIQGRTGIIMSSEYVEQDALDEETALETNRRKELQADCFSGAMMNGATESSQMTEQDRADIVAGFQALGGPEGTSDDHGRDTSRAYWSSVGLTNTSLTACKTYDASSDLVA
jgi:predicted metalloprotease